MTLAVGQAAPDFELIGTTSQPIKLSDLRGQKTAVVAFFELAFNDDCVAELEAFEEALPEFEAANAQVLAISIDPVGILQGFAAAQGLNFPLLTASLRYEVLKQFGAWQDSLGFASEDGGIASRVTYVIDKDGAVRSAIAGLEDVRDHAKEALQAAQALA